MKYNQKTPDYFLNEVFNLVGNEFTVLSDYNTAYEKVLFCHNNESCDFYEFYMSPHAFLQGQRCPKCRGKLKKNTKIFRKEVHEISGGEYVVLGEYKNSQTKIDFKHTICDSVFKMIPNAFLNGQRCPQCAKIRKTNDQFIAEVFELVGNEYEVLDTYVDCETKIRIKHNVCGCVSTIAPSAFLRKTGYRRCTNCSNYKKSHDQFVNEVYNLVIDEYSVLGEYVNGYTKIKMKHNICGNVYSILPSNFLCGQRCAKCAGNAKKTTEQYKQEVYNLVGEEYEVLGEYINALSKIKMKHIKCGHIWSVCTTSFVNSESRCPRCNCSKGEEKIAKWLDLFLIDYIPQFIFDECKFKKHLPFDFAIFDEKNNLKYLIEYDGQQHFEPIEHFGGEKQFKIQQQNDRIKNQYCRENNIILYRIPYWKFNEIESILYKLINSQKLEVDETSFLIQ